MTEPRGRRKNNKPWKHIYGVDRRYTARVDRLRARNGTVVQGPKMAALYRAAGV